jgi:alkylation response protein AidB-like acyl-CoA dehydrogenase
VNFTPDPADAAFREEVRTFLRAHLPAEVAERNRRGFHPTKADELWWTQVLYRKGWSAPHWPVEYGGTGWSPQRRFIFEEECFLAGAPPTCAAGFSLLGPVLYTHGSDAQKATTTSSTARRPGPPKATTPTGCSASCAPTPAWRRSVASRS